MCSRTTDLYKTVFGYLDERRAQSPRWPEHVAATYRRAASVCKLTGRIERFFDHPDPRRNLVFMDNKFSQIITGLEPSEVLVAGGPKQLVWCISKRIAFASTCQIYILCTRALIDIDASSLSSALAVARGILNKYRPRYVILANDSLPMQRIFALAAREEQIFSICIQHGIFQSRTPPHLLDGRFADMMLVYDEHQRGVVETNGVPSQKIRTMGVPFDYVQYPDEPDTDRSVCFFGQPWDNYNETTAARYRSIVDDTLSFLEVSGVPFVYKPHPAERCPFPKRAKGKLFRGSMAQALARHQVYVSLTSTALLEASLSNRVAIQIYDEAFNADRFEDAGYTYTVAAGETEALLHLVRVARPIRSSVIEALRQGTAAERLNSALRIKDPACRTSPQA
jgi:hypothetical protein